jgi:hypothetical protein
LSQEYWQNTDKKLFLLIGNVMKTTIKKQQSKIGAINSSIKPYYSSMPLLYQSIGITPKDSKKQDMYHYDGVGCTVPAGRSVCVYLLKAYIGSDQPDWEDRYQNTNNEELDQYALGVYSRGELKQMRAHAKRHTARTGEITGEMETFIAL